MSTDSDIKPIPITARQLEAIVRLSEACARLRLGDTVTSADAQKAISLLKDSLMQVGYDEESKTFDIDKITTGLTSAKRGKIVLVKETISRLESRIGKLIPLEELEKEIGDKMTTDELNESIDKLAREGEIFRPKNGYIQKM